MGAMEIGWGGGLALVMAAGLLLLGGVVGWSLGRPRRQGPAQAAAADTVCGISGDEAVSPTPVARPGTDIHLVMNTMNRLAGEAGIEGGAAADQIYVLSDYLRHCLVHAVPSQVSLHEEVELLEAYLRLAAGIHGCDLRASVEMPAALPESRLQAHSICLVAQTLLAALSSGAPARRALPVRIRAASAGGLDIDMAVATVPRPLADRLRRVRRDMQRLSDAMSRRSVDWSCRVDGTGNAGISIHLCIRPHPQSRPMAAMTAMASS